MKKYFCCSDVHSFFTYLKNALNEKGFDLNNPDHILVVLGDLFDRGDESKQLYDVVRGLPAERFIYIRGNHEDLLEDCFANIQNNELISYHHISNGTVKTIMDLSGIDKQYINRFVLDPYYHLRQKTFNVISDLIKYINEKTIDYLEIGDYILVHGWIPCFYEPYREEYEFDPEWRTKRWYKARWLNGMEAWEKGVRLEGKTIVCGHWHCSWGWSHIRQKRKEFPTKNRKNWEKSFEPFIDDGIIAIDACAAYSGKINCIVLEI